MRAGSPDCPADSLSLVAAEIVEDDDVAFGKGWHSAALFGVSSMQTALPEGCVEGLIDGRLMNLVVGW
nr:hypothetical protein [Rhizobium anhuiense]